MRWDTASTKISSVLEELRASFRSPHHLAKNHFEKEAEVSLS